MFSVYSVVKFSHIFVFCLTMTEKLRNQVLENIIFILIFLAGVNCKKLTPCKYFTPFLFMFILKLQLIKLKHSQIWLLKHLGKSGYQNSSF
jgi:hypothetical protein